MDEQGKATPPKLPSRPPACKVKGCTAPTEVLWPNDTGISKWKCAAGHVFPHEFPAPERA